MAILPKQKHWLEAQIVMVIDVTQAKWRIQPYLTLLYLGLDGKDKKIRDLLQEHVGATLKFFEIF